MFVMIQFNRDCHIVVQDTTDSMPYAAQYHKDEVEPVEILNTSCGTIHVQFEDGSIGWIKARHVDFLE